MNDVKLHFTYANASLNLSYDEYITPDDTTTDEWISNFTADRVASYDAKQNAFATIQDGVITPVPAITGITDDTTKAKSDFIDLLQKYNQKRKAHLLGIITDDGLVELAMLKTTYKEDYLEVFNGIFI